jgi:hypothetical protein
MQFNLDRVRENARKADTEDLLDRLTVYRAGMEPEALPVLEQELRSRGVSLDEIEAHGNQRALEVLTGPDGIAIPCSRCPRPAVTESWGWHRLWGRLPLFPRKFRYCRDHVPGRRE